MTGLRRARIAGVVAGVLLCAGVFLAVKTMRAPQVERTLPTLGPSGASERARARAVGSPRVGARAAPRPEPQSRELAASEHAPSSAYARSRWVARQDALYAARCPCESAAIGSVARLYAELPRVLVLDLRDASWNGLGNSLPRWIDMLRLGVALGRATFLLMSDCALDRAAVPPTDVASGGSPCWDLETRRVHEGAADKAGACQFDLGTYFQLAGNVSWRWDGANRARVHRAMRARRVAETRRHLCNYSDAQVGALLAEATPGCAEPAALGVDGRCHLARCVSDTLDWLTGPAANADEAAWLYLDRISQGRAPLFAQARKRLNADGSVTRGGKVRAVRPADCSDRYHWGTPYNVGCAAYGWLRPAPGLRDALAPYLLEFEKFDALVTVHVRSRYVDFAGQPHTAWERQVVQTFAPDVRGWSAAEHVDGIEDMLRACSDADANRVARPCAYHAMGSSGRARDHKDDPFLEQPERCGDARAAAEWTVRTRLDGPIARALTCAGRLASSLARAVEPAHFQLAAAAEQRELRAWYELANGSADARARDAFYAPRPAVEARRWGLFVMSDTPAIASYVAASRQLAPRSVLTHGAFAHNTYGRACARRSVRTGEWLGCERHVDPGGGWTRIALDLTLASLTDGLIGVPQSTFQDAVHSRSFTSKQHFLAFHFITRPWTRRDFRQGIIQVLQGPAPAAAAVPDPEPLFARDSSAARMRSIASSRRSSSGASRR